MSEGQRAYGVQNKEFINALKARNESGCWCHQTSPLLCGPPVRAIPCLVFQCIENKQQAFAEPHKAEVIERSPPPARISIKASTFFFRPFFSSHLVSVTFLSPSSSTDLSVQFQHHKTERFPLPAGLERQNISIAGFSGDLHFRA